MWVDPTTSSIRTVAIRRPGMAQYPPAPGRTQPSLRGAGAALPGRDRRTSRPSTGRPRSSPDRGRRLDGRSARRRGPRREPRSDSAWRFFLGSTACGRSITQICPSHTSTLNGDRSPWITSWKSMRSIARMHCSRSSSASASIGRSISMELRRGLVLVADVGHQDRSVRDLDGSWHRRPRFVQSLQRFPFSIHPDAALHLAAEPRPLVERDTDPSLLDELAIAVDGFVAEVPPVERVVDLQRRQLDTGRARVRATEMHARLFAALDGTDDPFDEPLVEEVLDDFVRQRDRSLARMDADMGQRRVLRELPRESRTAQRETEGRNARTVTELAVIIHPSFNDRSRRSRRAERSIRARGLPGRRSLPRRAREVE